MEFTDKHITQVEQNDWLSVRHISGALVNLKTFPGIDGMQDTIPQQSKSWQIPGEMHKVGHSMHGQNYTIISVTRIGVFVQGQILCMSPNGLQAGHCDAPPPHFG